MRDVPLRGEYEIVVADLLEVALLPSAAVGEGDVVLGEGEQRIGLGEIRNDRVRMLARIAHHVGHARLLPALIDVGVAVLACRRADVVRRSHRRDRLRARHLRRQRGHLGQVAQIGAHLPDLAIGQLPRRHAGMPDAVLDVIEQLAVAHALDVGAAQIRGPRILAAADLGLAAAVIGVTQLALAAVHLVPGGDIRAARGGAQRILHRPEAGGHGVMQQPLRDARLQRGRIFPRARAFPDDEGVQAAEYARR